MISEISLYLTIYQVEPKPYSKMSISLFARPLKLLYNHIGIIKFMAGYLMVFFLVFAIKDVSAQVINSNNLADNLANNLELYGHKTQSPILFIHFDKNIYTNNENVWFTAYFLHLRDQNVYFGETDHMIPWQIDHQICWRRPAANVIEALTKVVI